MALKSGGTIPPASMIADANQAVAMLDAMHHWTVTRINSRGVPGYSVTVTHAGRRVSAQRRTFVEAVIAALAKLRDKDKPRLRLCK